MLYMRIGGNRRMARKLYVIGNWKMYKTSREASAYIEALAPLVEGESACVYLAVPFTSIASASACAKETNIVIGAQNMNDAREGAFTGEIAGLMLKEAGAGFVLLGHSERRHIFGESNELIHKKILRAVRDDIQPVVCIGETALQRKSDQTQKVIEEQLVSALEAVPKEALDSLMIAYEPVWAIGTGKVPTLHQIQEIHHFCRQCIAQILGARKASKIPILYGGSVKPENAADIVALDDVDGLLAGGASLNVEAFSAIIRNASKEKTPKKVRKTTIKRVKK